MPHYKNGREVKVGDRIVGKGSYPGSQMFAGTIIAVYPGSQTCNASYVPTGTPTQTATLSDCLHEEDAEITVKDAPASEFPIKMPDGTVVAG